MTVPTYQPTNVCMFTHNTIYNGNYTYSVVGQKPNRRYLGDLNVIAQRGRYWLEKRRQMLVLIVLNMGNSLHLFVVLVTEIVIQLTSNYKIDHWSTLTLKG